ncbi:hypothetical protein PP301_gp103 [Gordonia phage GMA2]|uniref:Uncharacterized protein n=1 Tax=Gordonia phage GMA2 TaxID=1647283 RepID=A0A0K0N6Q3_9CAUD|nr:hypothetical protein PP301_gp103 [Gordonia phage GMA2]AKJ72619.1 hypothetical protein GMA2_81 [Gordonia phage GMA2]
MEPSFLSYAGGLGTLALFLVAVHYVRKFLENRGVISPPEFEYYEATFPDCAWCFAPAELDDWYAEHDAFICVPCMHDYEQTNGRTR